MHSSGWSSAGSPAPRPRHPLRTSVDVRSVPARSHSVCPHSVDFSAYPSVTKWWADIKAYPVVAKMYASCVDGRSMIP